MTSITLLTKPDRKVHNFRLVPTPFKEVAEFVSDRLAFGVVITETEPGNIEVHDEKSKYIMVISDINPTILSEQS